jgi:hypothetical protein
MGVSDPEIQKKVFGPRWEHEIEKQSWPLWKRLIHRFPTLSILQTENYRPKSSMRVKACSQQLMTKRPSVGRTQPLSVARSHYCFDCLATMERRGQFGLREHSHSQK